MRLMKPDCDSLKKVSVKIYCNKPDGSKPSEGTGTLLSVENNLFVLTAAHVAEDKLGKLVSEKLIEIQKIKDGEPYQFEVNTVVLHDHDNDCLVLKVENKNGLENERWDDVRLLKKDVGGKASIAGYHRDKRSIRFDDFKKTGENIWTVLDINITKQPVLPLENWKGVSGSGIFYKGEDGLLYMVAYVVEMGALDGNNNEFKCHDSVLFAKTDELKSIVDETEYTYVASNGLIDSTEYKTYFNPVKSILQYEKHQYEFIPNPRQEEIIKILKKDSERTILLTALSGLGKSRLLYEAFRDTENMPVCFYCKFEDGEQGLKTELERLLLRYRGEEGVVIVDDCPIGLMRTVVGCRDLLNQQFRVIVTTHDFFKVNDEEYYGWNIIKLRPSEMRDPINAYIEKTLKPDDRTRNDVEEIKKLSDGFPQMALDLIGEYRKDKPAGVEVVSYLMPRLLGLSADKDKDKMKMMWALSLCFPTPYLKTQRDAFEYLISENLITPLADKPKQERISLAEELVAQYKPTLIDVQSDWLYVRPFPLAVWLTGQWFKHVCNHSGHFKELLTSIIDKPQDIQIAISEGFCKHIQQMHGNKEAFDMVGKLVNTKIEDPFFNEEVLCSGLGSEFFLAMSTVNPAAAAECLHDTIESQNIVWLREKLNGRGRRNLVWALEKMCFVRESYDIAVMVLAKLAVAENESINNNATNQLKQLFHIQLAGTQVDLKHRLNTLKQFINKGNEYVPVVVSCFGEAFRNGGFTKICGAEKFGFENKKDYEPLNYKELYDYWIGCKDLLIEWLNNKPEIVDEVALMIEKNTFLWLRSSLWNIILPLIEKVSELKANQWEKEYEELMRAGKLFTEEEMGTKYYQILKDWIARLRPNSFITGLKEARQTLWSRYKLSSEESIKLSKSLFVPLAKQFIERNVYRNVEEVRLVLNDNDYIDHVFSRKLIELMSSDELLAFFKTMLNIVMKEDEKYHSNFLANFCYEAKDTTQLKVFLEELQKSGREEQYVSLMTYSEDDNLSNFKKLFDQFKKGYVSENYLPVYLNAFRAISVERYEKMIIALHEQYPQKNKELVEFVLAQRIYMDNSEVNCQNIVKNALINYPVEKNQDRFFYEYVRLLEHILEKNSDREFAKHVNHKMIDVYNKQMVSLATEGVFTVLLKKYTKDVWDEFIEKFLSPDYFLFYYQVKDELGSGYGFDEGPLFTLDEDRIKAICYKYPTAAPSRIASMAPCYEKAERDEEDERFSKWIYWLLDEFGNQKEVREGIHANLGSFYWTGSVIPYYERNIKCFEKLYDHPRPEVQDWARRCVKEAQGMMNMEKSREDFINLRYGG